MAIQEAGQAVTRADIEHVHQIASDKLRRLETERDAALTNRRWKDAEELGARITPLTGSGWLQQLAAYAETLDAVRTGVPRLDVLLALDRTLRAEYDKALGFACDVVTFESFLQADMAFRTLSAFRSDALAATSHTAFHGLSTPAAPSRHPDLEKLALRRNPMDPRPPVDRSRWAHLLPAT